MNKLEANLALFAITVFAAIQYIFLSSVPSTVSDFAFICITNLIGFVIAFCLFYNEIFRLNRMQIRRSFILSLLLFGFNVFLLLGSAGVDSTLQVSILTCYFVFIPVIQYIVSRQKPSRNNIAGIVIVMGGLFLVVSTNFGSAGILQILFLVVADIFFATYLIVVDRFTHNSNPPLLALGQMFFNFVIGGIIWGVQIAVGAAEAALPTDSQFWVCVLFISIFIRGMYGIVQIYVQRYISPLNTSLIFSSEIIITMLLAPVLSFITGAEASPLTPIKLLGAAIMLAGILLAEDVVFEKVKKLLAGKAVLSKWGMPNGGK